MRFGAEEARQAHNLEDARSKLAIATFFWLATLIWKILYWLFKNRNSLFDWFGGLRYILLLVRPDVDQRVGMIVLSTFILSHRFNFVHVVSFARILPVPKLSHIFDVRKRHYRNFGPCLPIQTRFGSASMKYNGHFSDAVLYYFCRRHTFKVQQAQSLRILEMSLFRRLNNLSVAKSDPEIRAHVPRITVICVS